MSIPLRHSAVVDLRTFSADAFINRFANFPSLLPAHESLEKQTLSLLVGNLIQKNEELFGYYSPKPRPMPKLPMRLFHLYKPNESLHRIFETYFQHFHTYHFSPQITTEQFVKLFLAIRQNLVQHGLLRYPKVYFTSLQPVERTEYSKIVEAHGGTVVSSENEATHIITRDTAESATVSQHDYVRVLQRRSQFAFVHWWFYPDSYDSWIREDSVQGNGTVPATEPQVPVTVTARWVRDLEKFNEYMSDRDYQIDSLMAEKQVWMDSTRGPTPSAVGLGEKRPVTEPDAPPTKRMATLPSVSDTTILRPMPPRMPTVAGPLPTDFTIHEDPTFLNISQQFGHEMKRECPIQMESMGLAKAQEERTGWFSEASIHAKERRLLPKLFQAQSSHHMSEEEYMQCRNGIYHMFQNEPDSYLSLAQCAKAFRHPISSLQMIHSFLEYWGLINYVTNPAHFPDPMELGSVENSVQMVLDYSKSDSGDLNKALPLQPNVFRKIFAYCEECEAPCSQKRWHHQEENFDVCPACYANGRYNLAHYATQFALAEAPLIEREDNWTPEETLALLQSILAHQDKLDWDKISEQVGHPKKQCLLRFLRLPTYEGILEEKVLRWIQPPSHDAEPGDPMDTDVVVEVPAEVPVQEVKKEEPEFDLIDQFFSDVNPPEPSPPPVDIKSETTQQSTVEYGFEKVSKDELPLFSGQNPVMALIAFLASNLHPSIAAAAARAVKKLTRGEDPNSTEDTPAKSAPGGPSKPPPIIEPLDLYHCALRAALRKAESNQADTEKIMQKLILESVRLVTEKIKFKVQTLEQKEKALQHEIDQLKIK